MADATPWSVVLFRAGKETEMWCEKSENDCWKKLGTFADPKGPYLTSQSIDSYSTVPATKDHAEELYVTRDAYKVIYPQTIPQIPLNFPEYHETYIRMLLIYSMHGFLAIVTDKMESGSVHATISMKTYIADIDRVFLEGGRAGALKSIATDPSKPIF